MKTIVVLKCKETNTDSNKQEKINKKNGKLVNDDSGMISFKQVIEN